MVVGGGPAGLAAAQRAAELGLRVLLAEWGDSLGGLPLKYRGLWARGGDLTAERLEGSVRELGVECLTGAFVHSVESLGGRFTVNMLGVGGVRRAEASAIVYAGGARERHMFELGVTGSRVDGVYTATEALALLDSGFRFGRRIVLAGGCAYDLAVAGRLAAEGFEVAVADPWGWMPHTQNAGLSVLSWWRVSAVKGGRVVERVVLSDDRRGEVMELECDSLVLCGGLRQNSEFLERLGARVEGCVPVVDEHMMTTLPGVFVAGGALIPSSVEDAVRQGRVAAEGAHLYIQGGPRPCGREVVRGRGVAQLAPRLLSGEEDVELYVVVGETVWVVGIPELDLRFDGPFTPAETLRIKLDKEQIRSVQKLTIISI